MEDRPDFDPELDARKLHQQLVSDEGAECAVRAGIARSGLGNTVHIFRARILIASQHGLLSTDEESAYTARLERIGDHCREEVSLV